MRFRVGGHPRAVDAGLGPQRGEQVGALDALGGAGFLHAQHGGAQVAVVRQGLGDQCLQLRIGEGGAPVGGGQGAGRAGAWRSARARRSGGSWRAIEAQPPSSRAAASAQARSGAGQFHGVST